MKKSTIVCAAILAVTVIVMVILVIVGINRNNQTEVTDETTTPIAETTVPEETSVIPPIESSNDETPSASDVDLDMGNIERNENAEVIDVVVESGTKGE